MVKQIVILIFLSFIAIVSMAYLRETLGWLGMLHEWLSGVLSTVFSGSTMGKLVREIIALIVIPLGVALVPAGLYWAALRKQMPYTIHIFIGVWGMLLVSIILHP